MHKLPFAISCIAILLLTANGCRQKESEPYPPIGVQRAALDAREKVESLRILDSLLLHRVLFSLSDDSCEGRRPGSSGHQKAKQIIHREFKAIGIDSFDNSLFHIFPASGDNQLINGTNIVGWVKGRSFPEKYIVISAHYDHLGKQSGGSVYSGADDNASGVGAVIALAKYFRSHPHPYSLVFVAFDAEESGLQGAKRFVSWLRNKDLLEQVVLNINLDMVARSDNDELFVCGIRYHPDLKYLVDGAQQKVNVKLLMWHDDADQGGDWTRSSDHFPFHEVKIPFLYLGVEDHADYHQPSDKAGKISMARYVENCNAAASLLLQITSL